MARPNQNNCKGRCDIYFVYTTKQLNKLITRYKQARSPANYILKLYMRILSKGWLLPLFVILWNLFCVLTFFFKVKYKFEVTLGRGQLAQVQASLVFDNDLLGHVLKRDIVGTNLIKGDRLESSFDVPDIWTNVSGLPEQTFLTFFRTTKA